RVAAPALHGAPLDDARPPELGETLREEIARDARQAQLQLAEAVASVQQLANDERRPPLSEDVRAARHRTELAVVGHGASQRSAASRSKFIFWSVRARGEVARCLRRAQAAHWEVKRDGQDRSGRPRVCARRVWWRRTARRCLAVPSAGDAASLTDTAADADRDALPAEGRGLREPSARR